MAKDLHHQALSRLKLRGNLDTGFLFDPAKERLDRMADAAGGFRVELVGRRDMKQAHQAAALAGSPLTTCYRGDGTYVSTINVDIRWHEDVIFPIPVPPILVHEGLLHYAVTHSEDLTYYTRVYRHRHTD